MQAEIIQSILAGNDTLALMPTGGGKSICFQVPTLMLAAQKKSDYGQKGNHCLCLVISPLIALMKDQVESLKSRGIHAAAIYTGQSLDKQRMTLDNCLFGPYRFLYVSPERLESEEFCRRLEKLPIRLIAIDEAHCISQWGHDFRPAYRQISKVRKLLQNVPVLAVTATATPEVTEDICRQLTLNTNETDALKAWKVFRNSFHRENLHYIVKYTEKKAAQTIQMLNEQSGSAIVYVCNRKRAEELAELLRNNGICADYYHAGLDSQERTRKQDAWKEGTTRVIVCTYAFGMGIDKPDVRQVIHIDLPDSLEEYFQEAGRAGRDRLPARAVLLYCPHDKVSARKRVRDNYPSKEYISEVYQKTCDYLQVGAGSGLGHTFFVDFRDLCAVMHLSILPTYSALKTLTLAGYINFRDEQEIQPRVKINVSRDNLYDYSFTNQQEQVLNKLMREYTGIFTDLQYLRTNEDKEIHDILISLTKRGIITYIGSTRACPLTFTREREVDVYLPPHVYDDRERHYISRIQAMVEYAEQNIYCREQIMLHYFGEESAEPCLHCDVCLNTQAQNI